MTPDNDLLAELAQVSNSLNSESDRVNTIIDEYEAYLATLRIGLTVFAELAFTAPQADDWTDEEHYDLGYEKMPISSNSTKERWRVTARIRRIATHTYTVDDLTIAAGSFEPARGSGEVLRDMLRIVRVRAVSHLDKLTKAILDRAKSFEKTVRDAVEKA